MIIPFGKLTLGDKSIDLLLEAPLNFETVRLTHTNGSAQSGKLGLRTGSRITYELDQFAKENKIQGSAIYSLENHSMLDAYFQLIIDATDAGANAMRVTGLSQSKSEINEQIVVTTALTAEIYTIKRK